MNAYPVRVSARPDAPGRWLWLVKWLLLIPHYVVLAVAWVAFAVLTLVAYVAVLFTGRYPTGIFEFNVGVLRWTWRVGYYGYWVLGTDRYPPFTLADVADYPARLAISGPPQPPRWRPLVAWLLAMPHILLLTALTAGGWRYADRSGDGRATVGLLGMAVLIVGLALLFGGRYPRGLYDLLVGIARWFLRTTAYVALLTDAYPPLRLDQGADEPVDGPDGPATSAAAPDRKAAPVRTGVVGRTVALVAGVLLLLAGGGAAVGGAAVFAFDGTRTESGYVTSGSVDLSSPTAAITTDGIEVGTADLFGRSGTAGFDAVRVSATGDPGTPLFLGVARQADVDTWLGGVAHDRMMPMGGRMDHARYHRDGGAMRPVTAPAGRDFWLASATGTGSVQLDWATRPGRFVVVLTNADGSMGVAAEAVLAIRIPALRTVGAVALAGGAVAVLLAVVLITVGAVGLGRTAGNGGPRTPRRGPTGPSGPPPAPPAGTVTGQLVGGRR